MAGAPKRRALRTETVECPAWSDEPFEMREPTIAEFLSTEKITSSTEKAVALLGYMVLGADGKSVGKQAIMDGSLLALGQLSKLIPMFTGEQAGSGTKEGEEPPLDQPSASAIDLH